MKKIAYLFGITFLILQSCSSSDNDSNTSSYVLVRKTIETFPQGAYTTTYEYSGNKIVSATAQLNGEVLTGYYTYTGDFISEFNIFGSGNFLREKYIYNYTLDNKVASFIQLDYQNNTGKRATYTYNADGTILSNEYWGSLTSQTTLFNTKTIFFQNGEVSSVIENNGSSIKTLYYSYDNKNYPFKNVLGSDKLSCCVFGSFVSQISHNLTQINRVTSGASYLVSNWQYTYNSNDYPTLKSSVEYPDETTQYFY